MSFNKFTTFKVERDDLEVIDNELVKTAAVKLPDGFTYDPDYLYLKVKAVSAGEYWGSNKNDDYFPESELKQWYKTFLTAHTFKNHENKKIEGAIGDVLTADWNDKMKAVYLFIRIDKKIAPSIVRGYERGFMTDVSMGCRVDHVVCSYCNKKAKTRFDYCDHLKTMKGRVMDNGKKVYEINIAPKFHDISAVLNGAERSAKVEGIYVENNKVAFAMPDKGMQKTASIKDSMSDFVNSTIGSSTDSNMEILASSFKPEKEVTVGDAKSTLTSMAIEKAASDMLREGLESVVSIADMLRQDYTQYMDGASCRALGAKLRAIAKSNGISNELAFKQFLNVCDAAAINLSPTEIHDIFYEAMDMDSHNVRDLNVKKVDMHTVNKAEESLLNGDRLDTAMGVAKTIKGCLDSDGDVKGLSENPTAKIKAIIVRSPKAVISDNGEAEDEIMEKIVSSMLESRSNHSKFAIPRLSSIMNGDAPCCKEDHFTPIKMIAMKRVSSAPDMIIPGILSALLHSAYQNRRVDNFNSGKTEQLMAKFASYFDVEIEKSAKIGPKRVAMTTFPLALSYSALQRSRMNNGDEISSLNRFIADNPTNAAFLASVAASSGTKKGRALIKSIAEKASNLKTASENYDIFKNENIDSELISKGYSKADIGIVKKASLVRGIGSEDIAENMLLGGSLSFDDMDEYLKTASHCFKIELEKSASSILKSIGQSLAGDVVLSDSKRSMVSSLPGFLADGLIFAGISKGLNSKLNKKEGGVENEQVL